MDPFLGGIECSQDELMIIAVAAVLANIISPSERGGVRVRRRSYTEIDSGVSDGEFISTTLRNKWRVAL